MMFFSLPTNLSAGVVSLWLPPDAIVKLDTACCSSSLRSTFLDLLQSPAVVQNDCSTMLCSDSVESWLRWYTLRKLKVLEIHLPGALCKFPSSTLEAFIAAVGGRHVTAVSVADCDQDLHAIFEVLADTCRAVEYIVITDCGTPLGVELLFHCSWQTLRSIFLKGVGEDIDVNIDGLSFPAMRKLYLTGVSWRLAHGLLACCGDLTDVGLEEVQLNEAVMHSLAAHAARLLCLDLSNCSDIDAAALTAFAQDCSALHVLTIQLEPHNDDLVVAFVEAAPQLNAL
jgi:hypothetical protein